MTVAKPTHDELIRELTKEVAILNERLNTVREEVKELKRGLEEAGKKRWALLPPVVGAVVSALLAGLVAYIIARK
jgi:predicted  nucleic acid-binding Zn-ribbon protein